MTRLAAPLAVLPPFPLGLLPSPPRLFFRPDPLLRRRRPGIRAVHRQPPLQLRDPQYLGDPDEWAFAIWQASTDSYAGSVLLDGRPAGHPKLALDTACTLYLAGTSDHPVQPDKPLKDLRGAALVSSV